MPIINNNSSNSSNNSNTTNHTLGTTTLIIESEDEPPNRSIINEIKPILNNDNIIHNSNSIDELNSSQDEVSKLIYLDSSSSSSNSNPTSSSELEYVRSSVESALVRAGNDSNSHHRHHHGLSSAVDTCSDTATSDTSSSSSDSNTSSAAPSPKNSNRKQSHDDNNINGIDNGVLTYLPTISPIGNDAKNIDLNVNANNLDYVSMPDGYDPSSPASELPIPGISVSYVNPKLEARVSNTGSGIFAINPIKQGETLIVWTGRIVSAEQALLVMNTLDKHYLLQIADGFYQCPLQPYREPADWTNHSCEPNAGFGKNSPICLSAMKDLEIGDEIFFDYGMCETDERLWEPMKCECGTPSCRGEITANDWKLHPNLWEKYKGYFAPHVQQKIDEYKPIYEKELKQKQAKEENKTNSINNFTSYSTVSSSSCKPDLFERFLSSFLLKPIDFMFGQIGLVRTNRITNNNNNNNFNNTNKINTNG